MEPCQLVDTLFEQFIIIMVTMVKLIIIIIITTLDLYVSHYLLL